MRRRGGPMCPPTIPQGWVRQHPSAKVAPPVWETTGVFAPLPASGRVARLDTGSAPSGTKGVVHHIASPPTAGEPTRTKIVSARPYPGAARRAVRGGSSAEGVGGIHPRSRMASTQQDRLLPVPAMRKIAGSVVPAWLPGHSLLYASLLPGGASMGERALTGRPIEYFPLNFPYLWRFFATRQDESCYP